MLDPKMKIVERLKEFQSCPLHILSLFFKVSLHFPSFCGFSNYLEKVYIYKSNLCQTCIMFHLFIAFLPPLKLPWLKETTMPMC